uniref:replication-relaxation family protein n=1 Tax=Sulfobacillus thermosulfidooxidans TaxID=28034 RepID=UPI0005939B1B
MAPTEMVQWHRQSTPLVTLDDIMGLTAHRSTLTDMDIRFLEALLRYNFMTAAQASRLWEAPLRTMDHRLKRLFQWGLVNRGPLPRAGQGGRELVYALSRRGFDVLRRLENPLAVDWTDDWHPKSETGSRRLSILHELGRNEVCIAIAETAAARGK